MSDSEQRTGGGGHEPGGSQVGESTAESVAPAREPEARRLLRSRNDRVIAGVCGGLARYLGVDPVLVRIAALLLIFAGGAGLVLYVIGWVAMPEEPDVLERVPVADPGEAPAPERTAGGLGLGAAFVVLGAFFLVDAIWTDFLSWRYIWPTALIAVGAAILLRARR